MKKSLLILYNKVWSYRVEIFNQLNEKYDVTVAYTDNEFIGRSYNFKTLYTPGFSFGPFFIHKNNIIKIANKFDAVIGLHDIRWLSLMLLAIIKRKFKLLYWGIGVTASYENKFDSKQTWDKVRFFFSKKADALIFYSEYPLKRYIENGFDPKKMFVAHNTVAVSYLDTSVEQDKNDFLFIGTLYKQKSIEVLLDSYIDLIKTRPDAPVLHIIGGGPLENEIKMIVYENKLIDKVKVHGPIYDQNILRDFFRSSIVCISPNQAGLSVLTSMGYGVPYLTNKDAYTGGEIFNIEDKVTGLIYEGGKEELTAALIWVIDNKEKMLEIGRNAKIYYNMNRKPDHMAGSIINAVEFALSVK